MRCKNQATGLLLPRTAFAYPTSIALVGQSRGKRLSWLRSETVPDSYQPQYYHKLIRKSRNLLSHRRHRRSALLIVSARAVVSLRCLEVQGCPVRRSYPTWLGGLIADLRFRLGICLQEGIQCQRLGFRSRDLAMVADRNTPAPQDVCSQLF